MISRKEIKSVIKLEDEIYQMHPNILIIGGCVLVSKEIEEKIHSLFDIHFIKKSEIDNTINNTENSIISIFVCCGKDVNNEKIETIKKVRKLFPYIPIFSLMEDGFTRNYLLDLYNAGIMDHIYIPRDPLDIEMVTKKIELILRVYTYQKRLEEEKLITYHNMRTYTVLLDSMKIAYIMMSPDKTIFQFNSFFQKIINVECEGHTIIGSKLENWIVYQDHEKFNEACEKMLNKESVDEIEIKMLKQQGESLTPIWVRLSGHLIDNEGKKMLCTFKDITTKKDIEYREWMEKQKKRDKLKQSIKLLREEMQELHDNND